MESLLKDIDRLQNIAEFCEKLNTHLAKAKDQHLFSSELERWGLIKWLENIGEAAYKMSPETQQEFNDVAWKAMAGARHVYVHDYFKIDWNIVWQVLQNIDFAQLAGRATEIANILKDRYSIS